MQVLKNEFDQRIAKNRRYSLRAFAYFLDLHPSALCRILAGKSEPSPKSALQISKKLALSKEQQRLFMQSLVESRTVRDVLTFGKQIGSPELRPCPSEIPPEMYERIGHLSHIGILELTQTSDFKSDPEWIASRLGLKTDDVEAALELLIACGLLVRKGDTLTKCDSHTSAIHAFTDAAKRRHQEEIVDRAKRSLGIDAFDRRAHYGVCMSIDPAKIPQAIELTHKYLEQMCDLLESGERSEVYQLGVQLFPITHPYNPTEKSK